MGTAIPFSFVPHPTPAELIGQRFGLLTVLAVASASHRHQMIRCQCDCGNVTVIRKSRLFERPHVRLACGCLRGRHTKHSDSNSKLYRVWDSMVRRCHNPNHRAFGSYGGRGIQVCPEWRDYRNFKAWADSSGYAEGLTIDRIDNDNGYTSNNCRWATRKEQQNNRRCCVYIEHNGQRLTVTQWGELLGIPRQSVSKHFKTINAG